MIVVNYDGKDFNLEYPQINRNSISVTLAPVYVEKTTINGTIKRLLKGYRLSATWSYPYLLKQQWDDFAIISQVQAQQGEVVFKMDLPYVISIVDDKIQYDSTTGRYIFNGMAFLDMSAVGRFGYSSALNQQIWTDVEITAVSKELIKAQTM